MYYFTFSWYPYSSFNRSRAASGFKGSLGLGYNKSYGKKIWNTFNKSNIGDQVWLITSRQTEPDLKIK
jgi:hypothetical protein